MSLQTNTAALQALLTKANELPAQLTMPPNASGVKF